MRIALPTTPKPLPIWALALLLGLAAFFLIIGPKALDPRNIAWLQVGDPAQHYLGWAFYRQSPWGWPKTRRSHQAVSRHNSKSVPPEANADGNPADHEPQGSQSQWPGRL